MICLIKTQCRVLIKQKGAIAAFAILLFLVGTNFAYNVIHYWDIEAPNMVSVIEMSVLYHFNKYGNFLISFFPFLLVLPGGMSLLIDKKTRMDVIWISKCGRKTYIASKVIAVLLVTFLCLFIPFVMEIILNSIAFPMNAHGTGENYALYTKEYQKVMKYFLFSFYYAHPVQYAFVMSALFSTVGALVSAVSLAATYFTTNYYVYLFIPVYLILSFLRMIDFTEKKVHFLGSYRLYLQWAHSRVGIADWYRFGAVILLLFIGSCLILHIYAGKDTL